MAALEELEALLQSLQALKPPGVTKTKIDAITAKCVDNVQSESIIVQKIVQQFRNSPATHKLGVLYVVDSVTRQWMENARKAGQAIAKNAAPRTFASGVQNMTDVLPTLMIDLAQCAPENQKEKINKLLDIWERGQTFPSPMLAALKKRLNNPPQLTNTPPGSPPKGPVASHGFASQANPQQQYAAPVAAPAQAAPPQDPGAILAALASLGQQNVQANPPPPAQPAFPFAQNVAPPPIPGFMPPPPPPAPVAAPVAAPAPAGQTVPQEFIAPILQAMASGQIPADQAMQLLAVIAAQNQQGGAQGLPPPPQPSIAPNGHPIAQNGHNGVQLDRYEQNGNRNRERSRSPDYNRRHQSPARRSPPNRRDSPTYGVYDPNAGAEGNTQRPDRERGRGRNKNRGRGRDEYRQRTPPGQRRQHSPPPQATRNGGQPKFIEWDNSLPRDHIKVYSRTLFVGGASGTEGEIRSIFSRFGKVQTCIVNQEKRHAFVKMENRHDAVAAKNGMDNMQDSSALSKTRSTRWGVGFGPRDCSDYETGISVIPISRLTDADRKWVSTAEYGGTGGLPLEGGMVLEEPDIEIGAGVSSKAISRRVPPGGEGRRGGHGHGGHGGQSNHGHGNHGGHGGQGGQGGQGARGARTEKAQQFRQDNRPAVHEPRHIEPRPEQAVAVPPAVPGFGFQLPGF